MALDKYDLYIFDWDGTLSTSTTLVRLSRLFQARYDLKEIRRHRDKYVITDLRNTKKVHDYIRENADEAKFYANFYAIYSIFAKPKLREGSKEILQLLRRKRKKSALFSDSNYFRLRKEAEHTKILSYFNIVLSADLIKKYKPYPKGILLIAKEARIKVSKCLYIGDMATDVMTAKFAHMPSCAVGGGMDPYAVLKDARPDYLFKDTHELYKALESSI